MKKTVLAGLVALMAAGSANAAIIHQAEDGSFIDLYGRLGYNITNKNSNDFLGEFDARIGFVARQTINDTMAVIGKVQYQVNAAEYKNNVEEKPSDFTARYVWTGLDLGEYGKVTAGRVSSGLINFTDIGDIFALSDVAAARQAKLVDPTAVQVFRQDGTLQYEKTIGAFDFSAAYIFGNSTSDLEYGYNGHIRYTFDLGSAGKFQPIFVYQNTKSEHENLKPDGSDTTGSSKVKGDEYEFWGVGARYYYNQFVLGAYYSEDVVSNYKFQGDDSEETVWEVTGIYNYSDEWVFKAGYRYLDNTGGDELQLRDTTLEVQYKLTPRSSIFSNYVMRDGENSNEGSAGWGRDASEDFFHVGLRYEF